MDKDQTIAFQIDENLRLEKPAPQRAEEVVAVVRENLEHLKPWMPWAVDDYSLEHAQAWIERSLEASAKDGTFGLLIFFNEHIIGGIGIHDLDTVNKHAAMGYWIDYRYEGKGIITRCSQVLVEYIFGTMALNRVQINCNVENVRSLSIPERLGFKLEGTLRQAEFLHGEFRDWAIYGLLADDPRVW